MAADFRSQCFGRMLHRGFDLRSEGGVRACRDLADLHTVQHHPLWQASQSPTERKCGEDIEPVGREGWAHSAERIFFETVQSPRRSSGPNGIDQEQQLSAPRELQQARSRPVSRDYRDPRPVRHREKRGASQALYDTPADLVVAERRADAQDAYDAQGR
jgi:hypothetical protein